MCGIVGVVSSELMGSPKRQAYFEQALYADALRGFDSTGMFAVDPNRKNNKVAIHKRALPAQDFLDSRGFAKFSKFAMNSTVLVGHNRKATVGNVVDSNAHPFSHDHITMVHNGSLFNKASLIKHDVVKNKPVFDTDSETLTKAVALHGHKEAIESADGAYALVWYNEQDNCLYLARNDDRPLHIAFVEKENTMLIASESLMMQWIAQRNQIKIEKVLWLTPGYIYKFDLSKDVREYSTETFTAYSSMETNWYGNYGGYSGNAAGAAGRKESKSSVVPFNGGSKSPVDHIKLGDKIKFSYFSFRKYNDTGKLGRVIGMPKGVDPKNPTYTIVVHQQSGDWDWSKLHEGEVVRKAIVDGAWVVTVTNPVITNEDDPWLISYDRKDSSKKDSIIELEDIAGLILDDDDKYVGESSYSGPFGVKLSKESIEKLFEDGCFGCQEKLSVEDHDKIVWAPMCGADGMDGYVPLCSDCGKSLVG